MKRNNSLIFRLFNFYILAVALLLTSCSDMLETDSELVEFEKDNTLNHPTDSVYSVLGIINRMQAIADRTVLLGEARADLVTATDAASADLKRLAAFDMSQENKYNQVSDYYAVINNCNYYLAHIDTAMQRRGRNLFIYEFAAVKAFRAWTYLELVKAYGNVPLVLSPVMTEQQAREAMNQTRVGITDICSYFIDDLAPLALIDLPQFGPIDGMDSQRFFIPMRVLLGDLCLWAGRYEESARWYNSYLNDRDHPVAMNYSNRIRWTSITDYNTYSDGYYTQSSLEVLSYIPMESRVFDGVVSDLPNIFSSTRENFYYCQLTPSQAMRRLSADQIYCMQYKTETRTDTIYPPRSGFANEIMVGDLRLCSNFSLTSLRGQDPYSEYSSVYQYISKVESSRITTCRNTLVWLHYAEALNRAGYPQSAMTVLKYGLCQENIINHVDSIERAQAADLISLDATVFTRETTIGIHSLGSGESDCNAYYTLPEPATALATRADTVAYQIPLVEDLIVNEMALEGSFEGCRYYDLMRVALRRGNPAYLADPVSRRNGETDEALRALLMDTKNWYLPLR
ncbi:MAG: RagB/SusD family nutrient uptake outer membrane protein [Prevotella sp.]|nr:RagB/SusD family nutrient uptake outer membrane protein [Prevotella sp.]